MYTFYDARTALSNNFEIANRYGAELLDDVARWLVGQGSWVIDLPVSCRDADRFILANAQKIVREYFDYACSEGGW